MSVGAEGRSEESGTENAPMCWVIPPASPVATEECRSESRRVVLPWSTCPYLSVVDVMKGWWAYHDCYSDRSAHAP